MTVQAPARTRLSSRVWALRGSGSSVLLAGRCVQLGNGLLLSTLLVRLFGLDAVGSFAIGIAAINVLANVCPLGLSAYLPRLKQTHAESCFTALVLQLVQIPLIVVALYFYAQLQARNTDEVQIILLVASSGFFIGLANSGLMLSIMRDRFTVGLIAPLCESAGLLAGGLVARTPVGFAATVLAARILSAFVIWVGFEFRAVPIRRLREIARVGTHYLTTDVLSILPEQSVPVILGALVTRGELGAFRLCQQLLMAADSPGWTFVQSRYPKLVDGDATFFADTARQVRRTALSATVLCLLGSFVLAVFFFKTPLVGSLMVVPSLCLAWRYDNYFYGQALRAAGRTRVLVGLGLARLVGAIALYYAAVVTFGLWGAIGALATISILSGSIFRYVYLHPAPEAHVLSGSVA
jgi:O-antigen/teichoic acid export membrane protein